MEKCSKKIIDYMLNNNIISEQDKEIYLFGLISMLRTVLNIMTLISIGILFGMLVECIVFVIFIILLRTYSGGFHSDNPTICYFISVIIVILTLLNIKFETLNVYSSIILLAVSLVLILKYAPVGHKNKPLEEIEIKVYRRRLLATITGLLFISILLMFWNSESLLIAGNMAFLVNAFMILLSKKKEDYMMKCNKKNVLVILFLIVGGFAYMFMIGNGTVFAKNDKEGVKRSLSIIIEQAAVELVRVDKENGITAKYDKSVYDVNIKNTDKKIDVMMKGNGGSNSAKPIVLYIPNEQWSDITLDVKNGSLDCDGAFSKGNILARFDSSNIDFRLSSKFEGEFKGNTKGSNLNFSTTNRYKNCDVKITNLGGSVEVPYYFNKEKNVYSYSNGDKKISIKLTTEEDGMTEFE